MKNNYTLSLQTCLILFICFITIIILPSCKSLEAMPYRPTLKLDKAPFMINKTVVVREFKDLRLKKDTSSTKLDFSSITNKPNFYGNLSAEITDAIIKDFSENNVFKKIARNIDDPNYVLIGDINEFKGINKLTTYGMISAISIAGVYTWLFGMPIVKQETNISIKLNIYKPDGQLVGSYIGNSSSIKRKSRYGVTKFKKSLPSSTNKAFNNSVSTLREKLLADIGKYK